MIDSLDCPGVDEVRSWREQVIRDSGAVSFREFCAWTRREVERLNDRTKSLSTPPSTESPHRESDSGGERPVLPEEPLNCESVREVREWRKRVSEDSSLDPGRS